MARVFSSRRRFLLPLTLLLVCFLPAPSPTPGDPGRHGAVEDEGPCTECCTSLLAGKDATVDGSTMTSHSCDSGTDRTWMKWQPHRSHAPGAEDTIWYQPKRTTGPDDPDRIWVTTIPQVPETYKFLDTAYPSMNEHQLAIGETTTGGKRELRSTEGLIDAPELYRLVLQRARTAREAIRIADELTREYGYNDWGECFTFADPEEVWFFEILGPGAGKVGAVWAAVRIPDGEIAVSANSHRILELDLSRPDWYMASDNVHSLAEEMGWWSPESGEPFRFAYAYAHRNSLYSRRREWRALSLLAPSLGLDPNAENYPLSVKPDEKVTVQDLLAIFRDYYADTPYDMTRRLTVVDRNGQAVKSPVANPFMNTDTRELLGIDRERTIASPAATYLTVTQSRSWLPDPIGGVVWIGYDNPVTTPHLPFYVGMHQVPDSYLVDGRREFSRDCAWWAFRRASKLSYFRYQEMQPVLEGVWRPMEEEIFGHQADLEEEALALYRENPERALDFITEYAQGAANRAVERYWRLGDELWVQFNNRF